jgi:hypothetical protein
MVWKKKYYFFYGFSNRRECKMRISRFPLVDLSVKTIIWFVKEYKYPTKSCLNAARYYCYDQDYENLSPYIVI